jgi:hypothetical protein
MAIKSLVTNDTITSYESHSSKYYILIVTNKPYDPSGSELPVMLTIDSSSTEDFLEPLGQVHGLIGHLIQSHVGLFYDVDEKREVRERARCFMKQPPHHKLKFRTM